MKKNVLVSVIVTSYNQIEYLELTIKSILDQSYPHIELIIVDDASKEGQFHAEDLIRFIDLKNPLKLPYQIIVNEINLGHTSSLNKGIINSNGQFIVYVNGDDLLPKNSISLLIQYQKNNIMML